MLALRNSEIIPFFYQSECLEALMTAEKHQDAALVVMAGGLGKTILSALNVKRRFNLYRESRCLFLCHQNDILEQAEVDYRKVFKNEVTYGFFHGEEKSNPEANIIFASFQTMRENLHLFNPSDFDEIVVDESHHSRAETYEKVIQYFIPKFLLGITMIPDRLDGLDIREIYGKEVYHLSVVDALARGLLCPVDYRLMSDEIGSVKHLTTAHGRMNVKLLNRTVFVPKRDEEIAAIIQSHIEMIDNPRAMIFSPSIEHAEILASMIRNSVPLHSKVPKVERKVRLGLFRKGAFKAAVSVDLFNEGLDIPEANLIVFLRSTTSPNLYYNQLARGLRLFPGKEKVIVLDFVANCERAIAVYELWTKVKTEKIAIEKASPSTFGRQRSIDSSNRVQQSRIQISSPGYKNIQSIEPFTLNVDVVEFKEKIVPLIEIIKRIREKFYLTWEEASKAAIALGCTTVVDYVGKYKKDHRLVSLPSKYYEDFPGWHKFLGKEKKDFYKTWEEASAAAIKLCIKSMREYGAIGKKYKGDPKLPVLPQEYYEDFPGWDKFLGKNERDFYDTWQEASAVMIKLGVKSSEDFANNFAKYKEADKKLHNRPSAYYNGFPGWDRFLNREERKIYTNWIEASVAAIALGITDSKDYKQKRGQDPRLPGNPSIYYPAFPGWAKFLKKTEKYLTWQEAATAVRKFGIKNSEQYRKRYKKDPRLPAAIESYYSNYPGWKNFLYSQGKENIYETLREASQSIRMLGITSLGNYKKKYINDPKLPVDLECYKDFLGWKTFLGKK